MKIDLTCPVPGCSAQERRNLLKEGSLKLKEGSSKVSPLLNESARIYLTQK